MKLYPPQKKPHSMTIYRMQFDERSFQCLWYTTNFNTGQWLLETKILKRKMDLGLRYDIKTGEHFEGSFNIEESNLGKISWAIFMLFQFDEFLWVSHITVRVIAASKVDSTLADVVRQWSTPTVSFSDGHGTTPLGWAAYFNKFSDLFSLMP